MDGYQRRTELKKVQIKRAALELFTAYGVEKVSLAEIAKKANVSPVTLYNYFGTKDKLLLKVLTDLLEEVSENRLQLLRSDLPFQEKIESMIFQTDDFVQMINSDFLKIIMSNHPDIRTMVEDMYQRFLPELVAFLEEGKREGIIHPDISTETILVYMSILKDASGKIEIGQDKEKNQRLLKELTKLFFYGLLRSPEPSVGDSEL